MLKITKLKIVLLGALVCALPLLSKTSIARFPRGIAASTTGFAPMKIGAGGFVRGIDIQCDAGYGGCNNTNTSTKLSRTDVYGAYIWCASCVSPGNAGGFGKWVQLVTSTTMPVGDPINSPSGCFAAIDSVCGVYEIRSAPSNTNIAYMMLSGYVYKTTNLQSCAAESPTCTWTATGYTKDNSSHPNDGAAQFGPKIAVDPADATRVVVCTEMAGCSYSLSGGTGWTDISTVPFSIGTTRTTDTTVSHTVVSTGSITFTTTSNLVGVMAAGEAVMAYQTAANTNQVYGTIASLTSTSVTITVTKSRGSGAATGWTISDSIATADIVAFDPSTTAAGATSGVYIGVNGIGVYHSTTGPNGTFSLTSSSPTTAAYMAITPGGKVYLVANDNSANLYSFNGTAWTTKNVGVNGSGPLSGVAIDPAISSTITVQYTNGATAYSTDAAANFSPFVGSNSMTRVANDIPWLAATNEIYMSAGQIAYDPASSNKLWFSEGIGVWTANPSTATTLTWTSASVGIEQLVGNGITSPPGGNPLVFAWDRPIFTSVDPTKYPSGHGVNYTNSIVFGCSADWATSSPTTIYAVADHFGVETSGISTNGGGTSTPADWTKFGTYPAGTVLNGGNGFCGGIAAASATNAIWALSDSDGLYMTTDGGANWVHQVAAGMSGTNPQGWCGNYATTCNPVCADRVNAGTFYAYNAGAHVGSASTAGIYKYNGTAWSLAKSGNLDNFDGLWQRLVCVPGNAGNMYYTSGLVSAATAALESFYECQDTAGTVTCSAVANVKGVQAFGFGKAKAGGYPAVYIAGYVGGTAASNYGIWRSDDHCVTWTLLAQYPNNSLDTVYGVSGDSNTYGLVYVSFSGSGFARGVFN